jgi:2-C-methyl-D-erythritol 4-phosphate cytidylyltransferase
MKTVAVIPAAGKGIRLKKKVPKPLVLLGSQPILIHTIKNISRSRLINNIILVVDKKYLGKIRDRIKQYNLKKVKRIVAGGVTRKQSVKNGLKFVDKDADFILIHDGARPFINSKIISKSLKSAKRFGASVAAVPVKSAIKQIEPASFLVKATLKRNLLWEVQTPQVFRKDMIVDAYKESKNIQAYDDAFLVEKMGKNVKIVFGSYKNIKITTPEDLLFAKAIIKNKNSSL